MRKIRFHGWRHPLLTLAVAAAAGCSTTPPPRLFTLAPRPGTVAERFVGTVAVKRADYPRYLDRPQVVRYSDPYELLITDNERWGEGMPDMMTRVLVADLAARLPKASVVSAASSLTVTSDVTLEVQIDRFEAQPDGTVVLAATWTTRREGGEGRERRDRRDGREARKGQLHTEEIRVGPVAKDPTAVVAAMSDALGLLSDRMAASI